MIVIPKLAQQSLSPNLSFKDCKMVSKVGQPFQQDHLTIYDSVDLIISKLISDTFGSTSTEDIMKLNYCLNSNKGKVNLSRTCTYPCNKDALALIFQIIKLPFFVYEKSCKITDRNDYAKVFNSYLSFNVRLIIADELEIYSESLIQDQSSLILSNPKLKALSLQNLTFFLLLYTSNFQPKDLESKAEMLFALFDYNSYGFIESNSKHYISGLTAYLFFPMFLTDCLINHLIVANSSSQPESKLTSLIDTSNLKFKAEEIKMTIIYKKFLWFMTDSQLMKEFVNYVSHNYIFEGNNSKNKLNLNTFKSNIQRTNYLIFSNTELRSCLVRFAMHGKQKESALFLEEIPKLIHYHIGIVEEICLNQNLSDFNINLVKSHGLLDRFIRYESIIKSEPNYKFLHDLKKYRTWNITKIKRKAKSMKAVVIKSEIYSPTKRSPKQSKGTNDEHKLILSEMELEGFCLDNPFKMTEVSSLNIFKNNGKDKKLMFNMSVRTDTNTNTKDANQNRRGTMNESTAEAMSFICLKSRLKSPGNSTKSDQEKVKSRTKSVFVANGSTEKNSLKRQLVTEIPDCEIDDQAV